MKFRTITAALAAVPLAAGAALTLGAASAQAATWQDTSLQVSNLHQTSVLPGAGLPGVAQTVSNGPITVTDTTAGDVLTYTLTQPAGGPYVSVTNASGVVTLTGNITNPAAQSVSGQLVVDDAAPGGGVTAAIVEFTENPLNGQLGLSAHYLDVPSQITSAYVTGGIQFSETSVSPIPASPGAPAYAFAYPGLPGGVVNSNKGMLTVAGSTAAPGTYSSVGVTAADQYGASAASTYKLVVGANAVTQPGAWGDEVNRYGNGFDVYQQHATANTMIVGWTATQADPATHFIRIPGTLANAWVFEYAPNGKATGLNVSDPGYDAAGTGLKDGLVLRAANTGPWQQWYQLADGTLKNAATGMIINPNGTGAQLRGASTGSSWGGSVYTWTDYSSLPA
jgi:hypothetical protein